MTIWCFYSIFECFLELSPATKRETHHAIIVTDDNDRASVVLRERLCEQWSALGSSFAFLGPHGRRIMGTKWMPACRWSSCRPLSPERYPRASRTSRMQLIWYAGSMKSYTHSQTHKVLLILCIKKRAADSIDHLRIQRIGHLKKINE